jgi:hypothetical protein
MMNISRTLAGRDASFSFSLFKNPDLFYFTPLSSTLLDHDNCEEIRNVVEAVGLLPCQVQQSWFDLPCDHTMADIIIRNPKPKPKPVRLARISSPWQEAVPVPPGTPGLYRGPGKRKTMCPPPQ